MTKDLEANSAKFAEIRGRADAARGYFEGAGGSAYFAANALAADVLALVEIAEAAQALLDPCRALVFEANAFEDPVGLVEAKLPVADALARLAEALTPASVLVGGVVDGG